jgi:hypothetical protein
MVWVVWANDNPAVSGAKEKLFTILVFVVDKE